MPATGTSLDPGGFRGDASRHGRDGAAAPARDRDRLAGRGHRGDRLCRSASCWRSSCFAPTPGAAGLLLAVIGLSAFVPLPLHATAWLGALGNAGRAQAFGVRPILVGLVGAAVVHALAALPWVVLIVGVGLCAVEPELEESALLDYGPVGVLLRVTLRRALGAIAAAALAVAVLTAGDMTVTDLLQIRTYAEEAYLAIQPGTRARRSGRWSRFRHWSFWEC